MRHSSCTVDGTQTVYGARDVNVSVRIDPGLSRSALSGRRSMHHSICTVDGTQTVDGARDVNVSVRIGLDTATSRRVNFG